MLEITVLSPIGGSVLRSACLPAVGPDQSCPWVGLTHGLGWVGLDRVGLGRNSSVFGGLGCVWSTTAKVLKL